MLIIVMMIFLTTLSSLEPTQSQANLFIGCVREYGRCWFVFALLLQSLRVQFY